MMGAVIPTPTPEPLTPPKRGKGGRTTSQIFSGSEPARLINPTEKRVLAAKRAKKRAVAKILRRNATPSEREIWKKIRRNQIFGYRFRRQFVIRGFVVDFYCHEFKLAIEIDGPIHQYQKEYDRHRQEIIEREGIEFLRIKTEDADKAVPIIVDRIRKLEYKRELKTSEEIPYPRRRG